MKGKPLAGRRGRWALVLFFLLVIGYATFMVLVGNRLIGDFLIWVSDDNRTAQVVLGLVWMPIAIGLGVCSGWFTSRRARIRLRIACAMMSLLAWLVLPIGPRGHAEGGGAYAPWVAVGLGAGLVFGGVLWSVVVLARERRRARP